MTVKMGKVLINFEATLEERERIRENAAWFGVPVATFVRHMALAGGLEGKPARTRGRA